MYATVVLHLVWPATGSASVLAADLQTTWRLEQLAKDAFGLALKVSSNSNGTVLRRGGKFLVARYSGTRMLYIGCVCVVRLCSSIPLGMLIVFLMCVLVC